MGERSSVGLQVAVDDAEGVQVLDRQEDLAGVEACLRRDMGRCGEMWGDRQQDLTRVAPAGIGGERWGDTGRCGEIWGDLGRDGGRWRDVGRSGEMWGDVGRSARLRLSELSAAAEQVVQVAAVAKVHDVVELNKKKSEAAAACGE